MKLRITAVLMLLATIQFSAGTQAISVEKLEFLMPYLQPQNDTVYVINFWATWCKPCVAELPHFTEAAKKVSDQKVQFVLVNLDYKKNLESTVIPFLKKNPLPGRQILLDETNYNKWISVINADWGGAIPVTLLSSAHKQIFLEREVKGSDELLEHIKSLLIDN